MIERNLPTERRIAAVELLLSLGYTWDGNKWNTRPTAVASHAEGEVVGYFDLSEIRAALIGLDGKQDPTLCGHVTVSASPNQYEDAPLYTHPPRSVDEAGHVVVTRDSSGEIVAVTRQDDDGHILSVIAEKFTDDERRKFAAEYALTHMSVQAAMAARGGMT